MTNRVTFHLNGTRVELVDPSPHLLLVDYLRSDQVGLTGTKKSCGQGGCGACTVVLSHWDSAQNTAHHRAANSCLRPVCSLDGMAVTTIEGTGSAQRPAPAHLSHGTLYSFAAAPSGFVPSTETEAVQTLRQAQESAPAPAGPAACTAQGDPQSEPTPCRGMNPVAYRLAANNGTQCGFCTPGFVMNMTGFLVNHPRATKADIEGALDGNLCRCTGYRPILTGMKTFASDWTPQDDRERMHCVPEPVCCPPDPKARPALPYPEDARTAPGDITVKAAHTTWLTAHTLEQLRALLTQSTPGTTRLVCANTSYGIYPQEIHDAARLIDIRHIPQLHQHDLTDARLRVGAATTYTDLITHLDQALTAHPGAASLQALRLMARRTAGTLVRNTATLGGNTMLVLHHLTQGEPFPSDLFTTMVATDTALTYWRASTDTTHTDTAQELLDRVSADPALLQDLLLLSYDLPLTGGHEHVTAHKTALREVNAHTLVNAATRLSTRASTGDGVPVDGARLVFAGIASAPWRARRTEQELVRTPLTHARIPALLDTLRQEATQPWPPPPPPAPTTPTRASPTPTAPTWCAPSPARACCPCCSRAHPTWSRPPNARAPSRPGAPSPGVPGRSAAASRPTPPTTTANPSPNPTSNTCPCTRPPARSTTPRTSRYPRPPPTPPWSPAAGPWPASTSPSPAPRTAATRRCAATWPSTTPPSWAWSPAPTSPQPGPTAAAWPPTSPCSPTSG